MEKWSNLSRVTELRDSLSGIHGQVWSDLVKTMDSTYGPEAHQVPTKATQTGLEPNGPHPMPLGRETRPKATSLRKPRHPKGGVGADGRDACLGCFTSFLFTGSFSSQAPRPARLISQILQGQAWGIVDFPDTLGSSSLCLTHSICSRGGDGTWSGQSADEVSVSRCSLPHGFQCRESGNNLTGTPCSKSRTM